MHVLYALIMTLLATSVQAEDRRTWTKYNVTSTIILQPTDVPDAVAEVFFDNREVHPKDEIAEFDLTANGLTVSVYARVGRGATPDRLEVFPPAGYYALPASIDVEEDGTGRILIYVGEGVGM